MQITKKITTYHCDCCKEEIKFPSFLVNDGSFQYNHISIEEIDLCLKCAARVLKEIKPDKEKIKSAINKLKPENINQLEVLSEIDF